MICNTDGMSTSFEGSYPGELYSQEKTSYGLFRFKDMMPNMPTLGAVVLTIDRWTDSDGVTWTIPESERPTQQWARLNIMQ